MLRASFFAVLVSVSALAQERVRVAVHPIVAPGIDDSQLIAELNREVQNILAETGRVTLVATQDVDRQLRGRAASVLRGARSAPTVWSGSRSRRAPSTSSR